MSNFISQTSLGQDNRVVLRNISCNSDLQIGEWVRIDPNTGLLVRALADTFDHSRAIGVIEEKPSSTIANVLVMGLSKDIFTSLQTSKHYFLSDAVQGQMTSVTITAPGSVLLNLGLAVSSTRMLIRIDPGVVRS